MSKNTAASPPASPPSAPSTATRSVPARCATAGRASASTSCGSRHDGRLAAMSAPRISVSSSCGLAARSDRSVSTVYDVPPRSSSTKDTASRGSPATASSHSSARTAAPGSSATALCGGTAAGTSSTRSSPRRSSASWASTRWPRCGGLNVPPRMPTRARTAPQDRTWPSPTTTYLNVHSSRSPIGPRAWSFCVELPISAPMPNSAPSVNRVEALM